MARYKFERRWFVYRMHCHIEGVGDYIGITTRPFERDKEHKNKKRGCKLTAAIMLYGPENFSYEIFDFCDSEDEARRKEKRYIRAFGTAWPRGLNIAAAGHGVLRDRYEERRKAQIAAWDDQERRRRHSERLQRAMNTKTAKERNSEAAKRRWADPEYRQKHVTASTGKRHSEETKQKIRKARLELIASRGGPKQKVRKYPGLTPSEIGRINSSRPDVRAKIKATWEKNRERNLAKIRAANAIHNRDPVIIAKRAAGHIAYYKKNGKAPVSNSVREKMSQSQKARWERDRGKIKITEETRARMSASAKAREARKRLLANPEGNA